MTMSPQCRGLGSPEMTHRLDQMVEAFREIDARIANAPVTRACGSCPLDGLFVDQTPHGLVAYECANGHVTLVPARAA